VPALRRQRHPARLRPADRGLLHGLSLVAITLLIFGALVFFAVGKFPLRCACRDGTTQSGTRSGFDSPEKRCQQVCSQRGGGVPATRAAAKDHSSRQAR